MFLFVFIYQDNMKIGLNIFIYFYFNGKYIEKTFELKLEHQVLNIFNVSDRLK